MVCLPCLPLVFKSKEPSVFKSERTEVSFAVFSGAVAVHGKLQKQIKENKQKI